MKVNPEWVRFKALNASARQAAAAESKDERPSLSSTAKRSTGQKEFLNKLKNAAAPKATPLSPRAKHEKEKAAERTGETPEGQRARQ